MSRAGMILALALLCPALASAQVALHLTFDDPEKLAQDLSVNGFQVNQTQGGPIYSATGVAGGAVHFDGSSYYRWGSEVAALLAGSFTFSVWIQTTQGYGFGGQPAYYGAGIIYADQPGHAADTIPLAITGAQAAFMTDHGSQDVTIHSTGAINTGNWVHLASTYDFASGQMRLYVNGVLQASATVPSSPHNARNLLFLGANDFDFAYYSGLVDEFQLYTEALDASAIAFLAQNPGLTVVPEPSTGILLTLGGSLLLWSRLRRKARG